MNPEDRKTITLALEAAELLLKMNANSNEFYERRAQIRPFIDRALAILTAAKDRQQPAVDRLVEAVRAAKMELEGLPIGYDESDALNAYFNAVDELLAAKSAAPVAEQKALTDEGLMSVALAWSKKHGGQRVASNAKLSAECLRYARDNGYLAPAKVDVDAIMEVVLKWTQDRISTHVWESTFSDLRTRLNKLLSGATGK